jgi:hypothetical protein
MNITYVSAFYDLNETPYFDSRPFEWNPMYIKSIIDTGVYLCLYIDAGSKYELVFREWEKSFPHFKIMDYCINYRDSRVYQMCSKDKNICLPSNRNMEKDTYEYLVHMHSRIEWLEDAISENPFSTTNFAWIDANLPNLFHHKQTLSFLHYLAHCDLKPQLYMPGCWNKSETEVSTHSICWRFTGGFILGDTDSILDFCQKYTEYLPVYLEKYGCLTWEVNFWAWLEQVSDWSPRWYRGDHNDSILNLSADAYTQPLSLEKIDAKEYNYPKIDGFYPTSASYIEYGGKRILNTRFVNYWIYPNGYYRFYNTNMIIENKNYMCFLDDEYNVLDSEGDKFRIMDPLIKGANGSLLEKPKNLEKPPYSEGLEDIRLYSHNGVLKYIATNVDYSPVQRNRMIVGEYKIDTCEYVNSSVIQPPADTWCEKNWIPVSVDGREKFIYKWSPMEIGEIDEEGVLKIVETHTGLPWIFSKIRGSTTFEEYGDGEHLVGLVHFSEEHGPRHYYHVLVLLERETLKPVKWTKTFCFEKLSIEFCIGMKKEADVYLFWISRFDRDPLLVRVDSCVFQWIENN